MSNNLPDTDPILRAMERRREQFTKYLSEAEPSRPCRQHPEFVARLDVERSWETQDLAYWCPRCDTDAAKLKILEAMGRMGVPERVRGAHFANYSTKVIGIEERSVTPAQAKIAAETLRDGAITNLLMCGRCGTGKGHLAAAVMRSRMDAGMRGDRWLTCAQYFRAYHRAYEDGANETLVGFYARRPLLVLDEIGIGHPPRDGELALSELLDARWNARRPTIVISNLTPKELTDSWLGPRAADRLQERSIVLWMAWTSFRRQPQTQ